jgi:transcription-repair coupling factor (superfamily II helicase)
MGFTAHGYGTGHYAVRGSIIDIYHPVQTGPVRLDLFGDDLEARLQIPRRSA